MNHYYLNSLSKLVVSHANFKVTGFVDFRPYLESLNSLEKYIGWLEEQLTDIVRNPKHKFIETELIYGYL